MSEHPLIHKVETVLASQQTITSSSLCSQGFNQSVTRLLKLAGDDDKMDGAVRGSKRSKVKIHCPASLNLQTWLDGSDSYQSLLMLEWHSQSPGLNRFENLLEELKIDHIFPFTSQLYSTFRWFINSKIPKHWSLWLLFTKMLKKKKREGFILSARHCNKERSVLRGVFTKRPHWWVLTEKHLEALVLLNHLFCLWGLDLHLSLLGFGLIHLPPASPLEEPTLFGGQNGGSGYRRKV